MTELYFSGIFLVLANNVIKEHLNCSLNLKIHNKRTSLTAKDALFVM